MRYLNEFTAFAAGIIITLAVLNAPASLGSEFKGSRTASANVVAVSESGEGVIGEVKVRIEPGNGDVLIEADPFVKTDTQISASKALKVAETATEKRLEHKDVTYSFNIDSKVVGGPSAGAAMTLATIAAIKNVTVPEKVAVTGTITENGLIGQVGGVVEKAAAAGQAGVKKFFVPHGQSTKTYYDREITTDTLYPGLVTRDVEYVRQTFSISNYTRENFNMTTEEVSNIQELYRETLE